jgi:hypothetical protein
MRHHSFITVPAAILFWAGTAGAVDLSKIDRTIKKEPAYQSQPKYCLLVVGPEAKHRVWLVLDGDTLYVDKNGNGDLTERAKRIKLPAFTTNDHPAHERVRSIQVGDISVGGLTHTGLAFGQTQYRRKPGPSEASALTPQEWQEHLDNLWRQLSDGISYSISLELDPACYEQIRWVEVGAPAPPMRLDPAYHDGFGAARGRRVLHFAWSDGQHHLVFTDRAQDAPVLHFGGPLTLQAWCAVPHDKLRLGQEDKVTLCLGTHGLGPGSFVTMCHDLVPKDVHPTLEVSFPSKEPGGQLLTRKYTLTKRC